MNKTDFQKINLQQVYANTDSLIWETQQAYESTIKQCTIFRDAWVESTVKYKDKLAKEIEAVKQQSEKVTNADKIAQKNCKEEYKEMLQNETQYKNYKKFTEGLNERIQTLKFIGRIKTGNLT